MTDLFTDYTAQELIFIHAYIETFSLAKAAKAAGCGRKAMMRSTHIQKAIAQAMRDRIERLQIGPDWVLLELVKLYETNLQDVVKVTNGQPHYDFSNVTPEFMAAVESLDIKPTEGGTHIKLKLPGKLELLKIIGKHVDVNAFEEKMNLSGNITIVYDNQDAEA